MRWKIVNLAQLTGHKFKGITLSAKKKYYYPTTPKVQQKTDWNQVGVEPIVTPILEAPTRIQDERVVKNFEDWKTVFEDAWQNNVASINSNNSITQYNEFILQRLSYATCSHLATDTIIHNAITKYQNEIFREGGTISINDDIEDADGLIERLEKKLKQKKVFEVLKEGIKTSLEYGASYIFIDQNTDKTEEPIILKKESLSINPVQNFKAVPPYSMGAQEVDSVNVLNQDYMKPSKWYVQGAGTVDGSRLIPLIIFKCPDLIKPVYNFGGLSLTQFMQNYVALADSTRQSLADIMLRFRLDAIKSDLSKVSPSEAKERALSINRQKNNLGLLLLTKEEEFVQTITPVAGLDKISAHLMEYVSVSARMPSVELFGLTPSGFNATGEFEMKSYNNGMASIQTNDIKPILDKILRIFCLEEGLDIYPEFNFNELSKQSELEVAQIKSAYYDIASKGVLDGLMTQEQAVEFLKKHEIVDDSFELDKSEEFAEPTELGEGE